MIVEEVNAIIKIVYRLRDIHILNTTSSTKTNAAERLQSKKLNSN